jgi:hypothetical protein
MASMTTVVSAFLDASVAACDLLGRPQVAEHWDEASCLEKFTVAGLAGHLLRSMVTVEEYLEQPEPAGEPIGAAEYYHLLGIPSDVDAPVNQAVRARGEELAGPGAVAIAASARSIFNRLSSRLPAEDAGRRMVVAGGLILTMEQYLRTRIVESVVHCDDLAESVKASLPRWRADTATIAIDVLVEVARLRNGDVAVVRALARRERDSVEALRVF